MNSRKRSQGRDGEQPQPRKSVLQENEQKNRKDATRFIKIYRDKYLLAMRLATRPPVLLMFLPLLSRWVVSWSSRSEDDSPLSIPHLFHAGALPLQFITQLS